MRAIIQENIRIVYSYLGKKNCSGTMPCLDLEHSHFLRLVKRGVLSLLGAKKTRKHFIKIHFVITHMLFVDIELLRVDN